MTADQSTDWANHLQEFADNLNNMPRKILFNHSPIQVENNGILQGIISVNNMFLSKSKPIKSPYVVGQFVRVPVMSKFKRGFKRQQSDQTYEITKVFTNGIEVNINGKLRRYLFTEVNEVGIPLDKDVFELEEVYDQTRMIRRDRKQ